MRKQTCLCKKNILFASIFLLITISVVSSFDFLQTSVNASVTNKMKADNNSTFSQSESNKDKNEIGMTFVIPNAGSNSNQTSTSTSSSPSTTDKTSSDSLSKGNEKAEQDRNSVLNMTKVGDENQSSTTTTTTTALPEKGEKNETSFNSSPSSSNQSSNLQRGEYKVDENGIHYYNINNCSEVKGSSGIGNLSECEDSQRQMREDL
jgi:hypothetical protein